jgi:hypothetical protein
MQLIPGWKKAARLFSVQAGLLALAWLSLPIDQQAAVLSLLPFSENQVTGLLVLIGLAGRLIAQPKVQP